MKTVSLFTGAGGLDLGLHAAGFGTSVAVEFEKKAVETLLSPNNREWWHQTRVLPWDVTKVSPGDILSAAGAKPGKITLLAGGPPCQPFSKSGFWRSGESMRLSDPRAKTLEFFLEMVEYALPEVLLLENVPGIRFSEKDEGIRYVEKRLRQINKKRGTRYHANVEQLAAVEFGVPQTRERVFVVANVDGKPFSFPSPTHTFSDGQDEDGGLTLREPCLTAWDAIGAIEANEDLSLRPKGKYAALLASIPEGKNYLFHTSRGGGLPLFGWRTRYWSMLLKLAKARPSWTLTAQPGPAIGPFHWDNRRLSAQELCAIQTIPKGYWVAGSVLDAHRQLGNAVPSLLTEILGMEIRKQLLGDSLKAQKKLTLMPKRAAFTPSPNRPASVPKAFLNQLGDHPDHPGTGKGPGAISR
jgi:DNA (cytosine-5)-methyltransferase 1